MRTLLWVGLWLAVMGWTIGFHPSASIVNAADDKPPATADEDKAAEKKDDKPAATEPEKKEDSPGEQKDEGKKNAETKDGNKKDDKKDQPAKDDSKKEEPKKEEPRHNQPKYQHGDMRRPRPTTVVPPSPSTNDQPGHPPSDAIILFDGTDLSQWQAERKPKDGGSDEPQWKVEDGYFEVVPRTGGIRTRRKFGSCQLHIEWRTPEEVKGSGQGRGNSGLDIVGHPEIQLLDSYNNDTYPDGQAASIYGYYPPLVNASLAPGQWQTYDIIYMAPRFEEKKLVKPATYTVLHNGVVVHLAAEVPGNNVECQFSLQDHGNPLRFRNIWVRQLRGYDEHPPSPELGKK